MYVFLDHPFIPRFLYVKTSNKREITSVIRRYSYVYRLILVGFLYQILNGNILYQDYHGPGPDRSNILLYQACYNPWSHYSKSMLTKIGLAEILVLALGVLNISCNLFLYRFLESHRKNNVAGILIIRSYQSRMELFQIALKVWFSSVYSIFKTIQNCFLRQWNERLGIETVLNNFIENKQSLNY